MGARERYALCSFGTLGDHSFHLLGVLHLITCSITNSSAEFICLHPSLFLRVLHANRSLRFSAKLRDGCRDYPYTPSSNIPSTYCSLIVLLFSYVLLLWCLSQFMSVHQQHYHVKSTTYSSIHFWCSCSVGLCKCKITHIHRCCIFYLP